MIRKAPASRVAAPWAPAWKRQGRHRRCTVSDSLGCLLVCVLLGLAAASASAQRFFPVRPPDPRSRLQFANYWSHWEFPAIFRLPGAVVRRETKASVLTAADYFVSSKLAVGGWWNPIKGADTQTGLPPRIYPHLINTLDTKLWDVHLAYYPAGRDAEGWSFQLGYSTFEYKITQNPEAGGAPPIFGTWHSPNYWISKSFDLGGRGIARAYHPSTFFVSVGYFPSEKFQRSANLLVGGAVNLSRTLTLSGSVWFFDFDDEQLVRTTVGVVGSF